jgi:hypothetical protein
VQSYFCIGVAELPRETEDDRPKTLPSPELNPLLNPLLGQHMGRWAEVYFTSPPERREEAVLELLRELEAEHPPAENQQLSSPETSADFVTAPFSLGSLSNEKMASNEKVAAPDPPTSPPRVGVLPDPEPVVCKSCGHESPAGQRFCGMCGTRLAMQEGASAIGDTVKDEFSGIPQDDSVDIGLSHADSVKHVLNEFPWMREDSAQPPSEADTLEKVRNLNWSYHPEPVRSSYRHYVGAAVAVLILTLGYVAWRGTQHKAEGSQSVAPAAPADAAQAAVPEPTASAASARPGEPSAKPIVASHAAGPAGDRIVARNGTDKPVSMSHGASAQNISAQNVGSPQLQSGSESGADDLAMAQTYLNGTSGHDRNSAQAAEWLWKAVSKQNADATLLLSDLYLKGDGVTKNCDQARVLLDAAASKGIKDAAERIRNLQAVGCQ